MESDESIKQKFEFIRLNNDEERNSFEIVFEISFWQNAYEVSSDIVRLGGIGATQILRPSMLSVLTKRVIDPKSVLNTTYYGDNVCATNTEDFIKRTLKNFLVLLKSFHE
jgi:hypothetical protein